MTTYTVTKEMKQGDVLIVPLFDETALSAEVKILDKELGGLISQVKKTEDFTGKKGQQLMLHSTTEQYPKVLLIGLGSKKELMVRTLKQAVGAAIVCLQGKKAVDLQMLVLSPLVKKFSTETLFETLVLAIEVAQYAFDEHKDKKSRVAEVSAMNFVIELDVKNKKAAEAAIVQGQHIGTATNFTRHVGNLPPSIMTPTYLANEMQKLAKKHPALKLKVLGLSEIKKLGMGCFLGVAQGSEQEPKFIIAEYTGGKKSEKPTVLVGKGITFDSGGLSLKPGAYMTDMKFDMLGASTVLGSIYAATLLGLKKNVVALVASCENMPSGNSYRPDDILTASNGKTVLIENTDAEGRLVLSDALVYAQKYKPKEVIDFATLTGACMVALGNERSALFTKDEKIAEKFKAAADSAGEYVWQLPLGEEYSEAMKSEIADYKNLGAVPKSGYGGASTAAAFLEFFTLSAEGEPLYKWAHIDLSCSYYGGKGKPWIRTGANGWGVATMVEYLRS